VADVTLIDGSVVDSYSEAWRHQCEAQHLLDRFQLIPRRAYLAAIKTRRGDEAYNRLTRTIVALWEARKAGAGAPVD
jgi:hypothetical protein